MSLHKSAKPLKWKKERRQHVLTLSLIFFAVTPSTPSFSSFRKITLFFIFYVVFLPVSILRACSLLKQKKKKNFEKILYLKTSGFWPRVRARALRAPVFLGALPRQTGRCAPPDHRSFASSYSSAKKYKFTISRN